MSGIRKVLVLGLLILFSMGVFAMVQQGGVLHVIKVIYRGKDIVGVWVQGDAYHEGACLTMDEFSRFLHSFHPAFPVSQATCTK